MAWWGWCVVGILLLGAEMFAIDAQFYLIFLGAGAIVVGLAGLIGIELPTWMQWIAFAVLSLGAMLAFRKQLYEQVRGSRDHGNVVDTDVDQRVLIPETLAPGKSLRIQYRGTGWTAVNVGEKPIPAGEEVRIEAVDGLTLNVRA
jgi:membrane protein implicated in regulation of membrane protease activity